MFEVGQFVILKKRWKFQMFHGDFAFPRRTYYSRLPGAVVRVVDIFPAEGEKPALLAITDDPHDTAHYRATVPFDVVAALPEFSAVEAA